MVTCRRSTASNDRDSDGVDAPSVVKPLLIKRAPQLAQKFEAAALLRPHARQRMGNDERRLLQNRPCFESSVITRASRRVLSRIRYFPARHLTSSTGHRYAEVSGGVNRVTVVTDGWSARLRCNIRSTVSRLSSNFPPTAIAMAFR
jgi:hypothetical protein